MINLGDKGDCLYDTAMQAQIATGKSLEEVFTPYIEQKKKNVYISIDIDGLEPLKLPKYWNSSSWRIKIWRVRAFNFYGSKKWKKDYRF